MQEIVYNDGLLSRSRLSKLLVFNQHKVLVFSGETLPGVYVVVSEDYEKNGKWSNTTYRIQLADGWQAVKICQNFETGKFCNQFDSLESLKAELGLSAVTDAAFEVFMASVLPKGWARFLSIQDQLDALEEVNTETKEVSVFTYTKPPGRDRRAGLSGDYAVLLNGVVADFENPEGFVILERLDTGRSYGYRIAVPADVDVQQVRVEHLQESIPVQAPADDNLQASDADPVPASAEDIAALVAAMSQI